MKCPNCGSEKIKKNGKDYNKGDIKQRYKCTDCFVNLYDSDFIINEEPTKINYKSSKYVITSVVNDCPVNEDFFDSLLTYCTFNNAQLLIIPIKYNYSDYSVYDPCVEPYLVQEYTKLTNKLNILAGIRVTATVANPLAGMDVIAKGKSLIVPATQLMMKCIAVDHINPSAILYTTGTISDVEYSYSKVGVKAELNHNFSALIVEDDFEIDDFHIRAVEAGIDGSFYDLDNYYAPHGVFNSTCSAVVLGDEHVISIDKSVVDATFGDNSIISELAPDYIIRHDILDFYSANHHHKNDFFIQYEKFINGKCSVEHELKLTSDHIINTTPKQSTSVIVASNHNDHLEKWANFVNPKNEPWNAKLFHELMYLKLEQIELGITDMSLFESWFQFNYDADNVKFLQRSESLKIRGVEVAYHGDLGINSTRSTPEQFSRLGMKTISAHSHTPAIYGTAYVVGTSSNLKLGYNKSTSSWNHAHCVIQPNSTRQMIFIKKGKWRV